GDELSAITPMDMVLVFAFRRRVPIIHELLKVLSEIGVPTLLFTDSATGTDRALVTWTISCPAYGVFLFESYVGPLSAMSYLSSAVARRAGAAGEDRIRRAEHLHKRLKEI